LPPGRELSPLPRASGNLMPDIHIPSDWFRQRWRFETAHTRRVHELCAWLLDPGVLETKQPKPRRLRDHSKSPSPRTREDIRSPFHISSRSEDVSLSIYHHDSSNYLFGAPQLAIAVYRANPYLYRGLAVQEETGIGTTKMIAERKEKKCDEQKASPVPLVPFPPFNPNLLSLALPAPTP
jgi:hypothetical protein